MKKQIVALSAAVLFSTAAFGGQPKQNICHNGTTVTSYVDGVAEYMPISFEINVSSRSASKHVDRHGDLVEGQYVSYPNNPIEECDIEVNEYGESGVVCHMVTRCAADEV